MDILNNTESSYSFSRYSTQGWKDCIDYLLRAGLSSQNVVDFMLSKHMRWAADVDPRNKKYGEYDLDTLKNYLKKYPQYGTSKYIKENL